MKKITLALLFLVLAIVANAQLKVGSSGRVTIGSNDVSGYPLSIKGNADRYSLYINPYRGGGEYIKLRYGGAVDRMIIQ